VLRPEQRALWSAQDFHALHVEHLRVDAVHAGDIGVIRVHGDGRLEVVLEVVLRDAAQAEDRECRRPGRQSQRGHLLNDVGRVRRAECLQPLSGDRGDGDADVLNRLRTLLRGD
jgi:hypothetical protein